MPDSVMPSNGDTNPLIPIVQMEDQGIQAVMGRDLHQFLGIKTPYKDWFPRMVDYGFEEGVDYVHKIEHSSSPAGMPQRPRINHFVSLDMAKEIAMIQRTDRGKQARQYFIECEKKARATRQRLALEEENRETRNHEQRRAIAAGRGGERAAGRGRAGTSGSVSQGASGPCVGSGNFGGYRHPTKHSVPYITTLNRKLLKNGQLCYRENHTEKPRTARITRQSFTRYGTPTHSQGGL